MTAGAEQQIEAEVDQSESSRGAKEILGRISASPLFLIVN